jgi:spore coat polysaccharide biosynthesis protein SpsF
MEKFATEQEVFWSGDFGDQYINRNQPQDLIPGNLAVFSKIISRTHNINSVIEFGANIGSNLRAIRQLLPQASLSAVEINQKACKVLKQQEYIKVYEQSILDFLPAEKYDLAFVKGVLIHIDPAQLSKVYQLLHDTSSCYICIAEYYNPTPVELDYRGHKGKLFKRDFAGEILDRFNDLRLVDYGFVYHRASQFPQDDMTWFLIEKSCK